MMAQFNDKGVSLVTTLEDYKKSPALAEPCMSVSLFLEVLEVCSSKQRFRSYLSVPRWIFCERLSKVCTASNVGFVQSEGFFPYMRLLSSGAELRRFVSAQSTTLVIRFGLTNSV